MINSYWETDLNKKPNKVTGPWNIGHRWPSFPLDLETIKANILSKIHDDYLKKMWPLECQQGFPLNWPGDLVFAKWPSFELALEIIKTTIFSKIHDDDV